MSKWTRCEDTLPPMDTEVLLYNVEDDYLFTAWIYEGADGDRPRWDDGGIWGDLVGINTLYWHPLPAKPKTKPPHFERPCFYAGDPNRPSDCTAHTGSATRVEARFDGLPYCSFKGQPVGPFDWPTCKYGAKAPCLDDYRKGCGNAADTSD